MTAAKTVKTPVKMQYVMLLPENFVRPSGFARMKGVSWGPSDYWFLARADDKTVGILGLSVKSKSGRFKSVAVLTAYRGLGIFRKLYDMAYAKAIELECNHFTCFSTQDSRPLFSKEGFKVMSEERNGIVYMRKLLPKKARSW